MMAFTKGPWHVASNGDEVEAYPALGTYIHPATICYIDRDNWTGDTGDANARLIANAPSLLVALEDAAAYLRQCSSIDRSRWTQVMAHIEIVIARAKGETS